LKKHFNFILFIIKTINKIGVLNVKRCKDYGNYKKRNELTLPQKITKEDIRKQSVIYEDVMWQLVN
jgi:hypothetical protein